MSRKIGEVVRCIVDILMALAVLILISNIAGQYQKEKEEARHKHDSQIYEQGYRAGWYAYENGDTFDPEYYE
ncbi:MAG: hypothetical protein MSP08_09660 [Clostridiales bacterium]|nr:hypothetical protein [Clostridiales bacterium]